MTLIFGFVLFLVTNALVSSALAIGFAKWLPRRARWLRSAVAAVLGPVFVGVMILTRDSAEWATVLVFTVLIGAIVFLIGLPCAYFTSRWQDGVRATQNPSEVFK